MRFISISTVSAWHYTLARLTQRQARPVQDPALKGKKPAAISIEKAGCGAGERGLPTSSSRPGCSSAGEVRGTYHRVTEPEVTPKPGLAKMSSCPTSHKGTGDERGQSIHRGPVRAHRGRVHRSLPARPAPLR